MAEWDGIAKDARATKAELAYRWVVFNSSLSESDACIIGARNLEQLEDTLGSVQNGLLDDKTCARIDEVWKKIEHEAGLDNFYL